MSNSGRTPKGIPGKRPLLYCITDRTKLRTSWPESLQRAISSGADFIQIREKDLPDLELFRLTGQAVAQARQTGCAILVNGRADIALAAGAAGVHLPVNGLGIADLRRWVPPGFIVGASTHSLAEAQKAASEGADYILTGPVFVTESKIQYGPPMGLETLARVCASVSIPVLGLGGIRTELIDSVIAAGAAGVAGISLFQG